MVCVTLSHMSSEYVSARRILLAEMDVASSGPPSWRLNSAECETVAGCEGPSEVVEPAA
jgi:hypothetical protein